MAVVDRFIGKSIEKGMSFVWKNFIEKLEFGLYPKEYNRNVHGPYVPSRYYGKVDTRFTNVKIGELIPWIRRRKMGPVAFAQLLSRGYHRWCEHYVHVRYGSAAYLFQLSAVVMIYFYFVRLPYIWYHKSYRYHW